MKTCWQILEIESTTQIDIIRQAYLARGDAANLLI